MRLDHLCAKKLLPHEPYSDLHCLYLIFSPEKFKMSNQVWLYLTEQALCNMILINEPPYHGHSSHISELICRNQIKADINKSTQILV